MRNLGRRQSLWSCQICVNEEIEAMIDVAETSESLSSIGSWHAFIFEPTDTPTKLALDQLRRQTIRCQFY